MPLAMEVDLGPGPGDIVRWGSSRPTTKGAQPPPSIFGPCLLWPNGWKVEGLEKRLGLGLARSQSRSRLVAKIRRLGLVELQEALGLGLVLDQKPNVLVSSRSR